MAPEHYQAHQLNQPLQILRKTQTADGAGGYTETEATLPSPTTYHMAYVRPLRGAERVSNEGLQTYADVRFVLYADVTVLPTDVLLYAGTRYNVSSILPPGLSRFREVDATSGGVT